MKTFELTQEQINQLAEKKHAKELLQEFLPEAFENKLESGSICFNLEDSYYGFDCVGDWRDITYFKIGEDIYEWELATEEEVSEALINEAKKRGYKKGVKCKFGIFEDIRTIKTNDFVFKLEYNTLGIKRKNGIADVIFDNGKWAEIIEEPKETEPTKEEINRVLTFLKNKHHANT